MALHRGEEKTEISESYTHKKKTGNKANKRNEIENRNWGIQNKRDSETIKGKMARK
jgi:hypothetical protein